MSTACAPAYIFDTPLEAEEAIQSLYHAGVDVNALSLIGRGRDDVARAVVSTFRGRCPGVVDASASPDDALSTAGLAGDRLAGCEAVLRAGRLVLLVQGSVEAQARTRVVLEYVLAREAA